MDDRLDLTVMVNGSRNRITIGTMVLATERKWLGNGYKSGLGYKRASQESQTSLVLWLLYMLFCFLIVLPYVLEKKNGELLFI